MSQIARLRSTPSMERLWAAAERDEEERLKQEVEKDYQAKMAQRHIDSQEIAMRRKQEISERAELIMNVAVAPKRGAKNKNEVTCADVMAHYCLRFAVICMVIIGIALFGRLIYALVVEYRMVHEKLTIILTVQKQQCIFNLK
jgi:uncharacterized membrane protein